MNNKVPLTFKIRIPIIDTYSPATYVNMNFRHLLIVSQRFIFEIFNGVDRFTKVGRNVEIKARRKIMIEFLLSLHD